MGMFVEVESLDKNCTVIINLDHIVEVAPLASVIEIVKLEVESVVEVFVRPEITPEDRLSVPGKVPAVFANAYRP